MGMCRYGAVCPWGVQSNACVIRSPLAVARLIAGATMPVRFITVAYLMMAAVHFIALLLLSAMRTQARLPSSAIDSARSWRSI